MNIKKCVYIFLATAFFFSVWVFIVNISLIIQKHYNVVYSNLWYFVKDLTWAFFGWLLALEVFVCWVFVFIFLAKKTNFISWD